MPRSKWIVLLGLIVWCGRLFSQTEVVFSHQGGFYAESFTLTLECDNPNCHVRYTTNGNTPTAESALYTEPLTLDERFYSTADIYKIQISPDDLVFVPDSVGHAIVIRAAAFDENGLCVSEVVTNTYFINSLSFDSGGLAVVSICADSLVLFDYESGVFVPGVNWSAADPDHTGNYYQHGKEWERKVNLEFYEPDDNSGINQFCGLRTHGNRSRRYPSKGMKIYARDEYGQDRFRHAFFKDSQMNSFKHLIIKPFASFWPYSGTQDYVTSTLALQLNMESPHNRPVVVYLNGEYWGIYFIQEKMDECYLEDHCGVDGDNCNIIGNWYGVVEEGNNINFKRMMRWFENNNLADDANYSHARSLIDMDNFIDYMVFQTFIGNWDWPGNNMRCWQEGNGPWRWVFFDGDATIISNDFDAFENAVYTGPTTWQSSPNATLLFRKLLENNQFKAAFKSRALELCNSLFLYENTYPIFNDMVEMLRPIVDDQRLRFGYPPSMSFWDDGNALIDDYLAHRVERYLAEMEAFPMLEPDMLFSDLDMFTCYPNPTDGAFEIRLKVEWSHSIEICVYNTLGMKVFREARYVYEGETVKLSLDLAQGLYLVRIGSFVQKVLVQ